MSRQILQKLAVRLELVLLLIIQNQTLATFSAIEMRKLLWAARKVHMGCMVPAGRMLCRLN